LRTRDGLVTLKPTPPALDARGIVDSEKKPAGEAGNNDHRLKEESRFSCLYSAKDRER
jgi:hypothetical protein